MKSAEAEKAKKDAVQDIERTIAELTDIRENIRSLANPSDLCTIGEPKMDKNGIVEYREKLEQVIG